MAGFNNDILNTTRMMNCGMNATCIAYRNANDIDVKFEDGYIKTHTQKQLFVRGCIKNPNQPDAKIIKSSCVGKKVKQHNGLFAECIIYRNTHDIDIQFEDGIVVEHKNKRDFLMGGIAHPFYTVKSFPQTICFYIIKEYIPEVKMDYRPNFLRNSNNTKMEIDIWNPNNNEGIEYDGHPWHIKRSNLSDSKYRLIEESDEINAVHSIIEKGCIEYEGIKHINYHLNSRSDKYTNEYLIELSNALNSILTRWLSYNPNIFIDDSKIKEIINYKLKDFFNTPIMQHCGMKATCIAYRGSKDIDVLFEDGTIVEHRSRNEFINGAIQNPNMPKNVPSAETLKANANCLNLVVLQKCGLKATCIAYRGNKDIDLEFEDGIIVENRTRRNFLNGCIKHPNKKNSSFNNDILGKTIMQKCGMKATCIAYRSSQDIDVKFVDKTIVTNKRKTAFVSGGINNPNLGTLNERNKQKASCVGMTIQMNNGQKATCIAYRGAEDLDVQFEDGTIVKNRTKAKFIQGSISNPNMKPSSCLGEKRLMRCGLYATCIAYRGTNDIDLQFEDGVIVKSKSKGNFYKGNISHK